MENKNTHHVTDDYGNVSEHATARAAEKEANKSVNPRIEVKDMFGRVVSTIERR